MPCQVARNKRHRGCLPARARAHSSTSPRFAAIDHVAIGVACLGRSAAWYGELLGFEKFRLGDPMFHNDEIAMMNHGTNVKLALLKIPEQISRTKPVGGKGLAPLNLTNALRGAAGQWQGEIHAGEVAPTHGLVRILRGHFSLSVETQHEFDGFRETLPQKLESLHNRLKRTDGEGLDPEGSFLWVEYEDYGVQESVFFHDPDLNEVEVSYWK